MVGPRQLVRRAAGRAGTLVDGLRVIRSGVDAERPGRHRRRAARPARQAGDGHAPGQIAPSSRVATGRAGDRRAAAVVGDASLGRAMKFSHFFIDQPVFAAVVSILITLLGAIAYPTLPVAQYPQIAPPTVTITATYPAPRPRPWPTPSPSRSRSRSTASRTCSTCPRSPPATATSPSPSPSGWAPTSTRPRCWSRTGSPSPCRSCRRRCRRPGVVVRKASPDILLAVHIYSPDGSLDQQYISNYFTLHVRDELLRAAGRRRHRQPGGARLRHAHLDRSGQGRRSAT